MGISRRRIGTYGVLAAVGLGLLATTVPAGASVKGRRNTTAVLGAATAYEAIQGHKKTALVGAAATAYAYKRTKDEKKANARDARRRAAWRRAHRHAAVRGYRSHGRHLARGHHKVRARARRRR